MSRIPKSPFRWLLRPFALLLAASLVAAPLGADSDEYSARAHLESTTPIVGGEVTLTVRSPLVGRQAIIAVDTTLGPVFTGSANRPVLCLSPSPTIAASGAIDASGRLQVDLPTPSAGTTFFVQGIVVDGARWHATNCLTLTAGASIPVSFSDSTAGLDGETALYSAADVDWADLDKDGHLDAVVANDGAGAEPLLLMGNGSGLLASEGGARLPAGALRPTSCVEVADVNGDSWPDVFLGGGEGVAGPLPNLLALGDGAGGFVIAQTRAIGGSLQPSGACTTGGGCAPLGGVAGKGLAVDAEFGDVDGDGDLDLLVTNVQDPGHPSEVPDPVVLYLNQGRLQGGQEGSFVASRSFSSVSGNQPHTNNGDASFGDVDNDGDLDVFVAAPQVQNQLYVNDGSGSFTNVTATALRAEIDDSFEADFGDFDGDGDLDIFVANSVFSDPTAVHLYENRTTAPDAPLFVDASVNVPASLGGTTDVRLATDVGDVDNDGDLDVVVGIHELPGGSGTDGETVLLLNQGGLQGGTQGTFAVDTSFVPGLFIAADFALGDVDRDGDLDLYLASSGNLFQFSFQDELWINDL